MKKLKLKLAGIAEILSKEQMKKINGGYHLVCGDYCVADTDCHDVGNFFGSECPRCPYNPTRPDSWYCA